MSTARSVSVAEIDFTSLLDTRPARAPDYRAENEALAALAEVLAHQPEKVAQVLVETALRLTSAQSAGLSLEEEVDGKRVFRWVATAGEYARYLHGTLPRDFSPCGVVLGRDAPVLMREPVRLYSYIVELHQPVQEVLLVPFHLRDKPVGTMWVVSHDDIKQFDREDLRLVRDLTRFAAASVQTAGLVSHLRSANEAQEAELALAREDLQRLQQWFHQAPGFLAFVHGPDHTFALANAAYRELVGTDDLIGKPVMQALPALEGQGFDKLLDEVRASGRAHVGRGVAVQLRYGAPDAPLVTKYLDFVYQPMLDERAVVQGIIVQGYECTERVKALEVLHEADVRKDHFLAALAHEMRTPLTAIDMATHVLQRCAGDAQRVQGQAQMIARQARQLTTLVEDLTDMSSIRSGKVELRPSAVTIQEVVGRALEACQSQLRGKPHRLHTRLPSMPITLEADLTRLTQVIVNLINNAIKYSPEGGDIVIEVESGLHGVSLSITDQGIGIPPQLLPSVFDLFMQAPADSRPPNSGLGIGLALVRQFVEMHGGMVQAHSEGPGHGSRFIVTLPYVALDATVEPRPNGQTSEDAFQGSSGMGELLEPPAL